MYIRAYFAFSGGINLTIVDALRSDSVFQVLVANGIHGEGCHTEGSG